jgi:flagellar protein FliS
MTNARNAYRQDNVHGASANRLVILLYDQIIQDLVHAQKALEARNIEKRTQLLNHAILVIAHLQSALDFDRGEKVAQDLEHFYNALRQNLVAVQFSPSVRALRQQVADVQAVREAWIEVEKTERAPASTTPDSSPSATETVANRIDWKG